MFFMHVFRECASSRNDTCPLVPRMAAGLAECTLPEHVLFYWHLK